MSWTMRRSARATSVVAATLLIMSFGTVGAAFADPGNGNGGGSDNAQVAAGNVLRCRTATRTGPTTATRTVPTTATRTGPTTATRTVPTTGMVRERPRRQPRPRAGEARPRRSPATAPPRRLRAAAPGQGSSDKGPTSKGSASKGSTSHGAAGDHKTKGTGGTSGVVKSPQPISGADDNPGGANGQCTAGVYCSTRSGLPSMNGQGKGKAVGKPCAGCVGKADNKNPHGQMPGPSDRNAGYECDRNNGIGKTNPAHTGCKPGTPPDCTVTGTCPPPPCVDQPNKPCNPPPPCVPTSRTTSAVRRRCASGRAATRPRPRPRALSALRVPPWDRTASACSVRKSSCAPTAR